LPELIKPIATYNKAIVFLLTKKNSQIRYTLVLLFFLKQYPLPSSRFIAGEITGTKGIVNEKGKIPVPYLPI
jgi:hypothetical protein